MKVTVSTAIIIVEKMIAAGPTKPDIDPPMATTMNPVNRTVLAQINRPLLIIITASLKVEGMSL
jgi:hypothetical protein